MKYANVISAIFGEVWAIMPSKLNAIVEFARFKAEGIKIDASEFQAAKKRSTGFGRPKGGVGVIPIYGTIGQRMTLLSEFSGGTSTERIGAMLDTMMADDSIGHIVFDIDSPGGSVYGVSELSDRIHAYRGTKPMTAVVNSLMASAAYWIGSAADEITVTPGGEVGSIGVLAIHTDYSEMEKAAGIKPTIVSAGKYKTEGNPHEPLNDEAYTAIKKRVDEYYDMFVSAVARNRGVKASEVRSGFGEGRVVGAPEAVAERIADRIGSMEQVISDLGVKQGTKSRKVAAVEAYERL